MTAAAGRAGYEVLREALEEAKPGSSSARMVGQADPACPAALLPPRSSTRSGMDLLAIQALLGHLVGGHDDVVTSHVHRTHIEDAWIAGQERAAERLEGTHPDEVEPADHCCPSRYLESQPRVQRLLAERGLQISAGKMSGLWSGNTEHRQARRSEM